MTGVRLCVFQRVFARLASTSTSTSTALATWEVSEQVLKPLTTARRCPYTALLDSADTGRATVFVSHAWSYPFRVVMEALQRFEEKQQQCAAAEGRYGEISTYFTRKYSATRHFV